MIREINGKKYELVEGDCLKDCVFHPDNQCILNIDISCIRAKNYTKVWKEVSDEQK